MLPPVPSDPRSSGGGYLAQSSPSPQAFFFFTSSAYASFNPGD